MANMAKAALQQSEAHRQKLMHSPLAQPSLAQISSQPRPPETDSRERGENAQDSQGSGGSRLAEGLNEQLKGFEGKLEVIFDRKLAVFEAELDKLLGRKLLVIDEALERILKRVTQL